MLVHIFGETSSPFCGSFCLKRTAKKFGYWFDEAVPPLMDSSFHVYDFITSLPMKEEAMETNLQKCQLLKLGRFHLTKWILNSQDVLNCILEHEWAKSLVSLDLQSQVQERVVGRSLERVWGSVCISCCQNRRWWTAHPQESSINNQFIVWPIRFCSIYHTSCYTH